METPIYVCLYLEFVPGCPANKRPNYLGYMSRPHDFWKLPSAHVHVFMYAFSICCGTLRITIEAPKAWGPSSVVPVWVCCGSWVRILMVGLSARGAEPAAATESEIGGPGYS